ncbi:MAG: hypothetical protein RLZZ293_1479 [Pseudomonadota bacterium]|jgi:shikimate dehydrogenase
MYQLAVIGNPISHSLSPIIWQDFAKQTAIELNYTKICAPIENFELVVNDFFAHDGYCLSVTAPFKQRAFELADQYLVNSQLTNTANHLFKKNQVLMAENTDGIGFMADLASLQIDLSNKNILFIGGGSVIHSVLHNIIQAKPQSIDLLMRDPSKISSFQSKYELVGLYQVQQRYDVVINTTPNSLDNPLFSQVKYLAHNALIYDMLYNAKVAYFNQAMQQLAPNAIIANGLGMLIQQAKLAFELVFAMPVATEHLYAQLAKHIS